MPTLIPATGAHRRYLGASVDPKPTTGVDAGVTFFETDTGLTYVFDGTRWCVVPLESLAGVLTEILEVLTDLRDETRALRLAKQAELDAGNPGETDFLELAQSSRDGAEEL